MRIQVKLSKYAVKFLDEIAQTMKSELGFSVSYSNILEHIQHTNKSIQEVEFIEILKDGRKPIVEGVEVNTTLNINEDTIDMLNGIVESMSGKGKAIHLSHAIEAIARYKLIK